MHSKTEGLRKGLLGAVMIVTMFLSYKEVGFSLPSFLIHAAYPQPDASLTTFHLLSQGFYILTDVKWQCPVTLLTSIVPGGRQPKRIEGQLAQIKGYFDQDENSHLTPAEIKTSTLEKKEPFPDLSNLEKVYAQYYAAPGKMDFGLDMLAPWDFNELAQKDLSLKEEGTGPKILIFHTHAREDYVGGQTVVDVGEALKETLEKNYHIEVLHLTQEFYEPDNPTKFPTKVEYERMEPVIEKILQQYPSIEVVMDLHRDGVDQGVRLVTEVEGKKAAKIMFVNGLCLNRNLKGEVEKKEGLPNPYLSDNLAFSLQSMLIMNQLYPGLGRKIYLNEWRYSTHMKPRSLLVEWGAQTNTGQEALNAVEPMAKVLMTVLKKD